MLDQVYRTFLLYALGLVLVTGGVGYCAGHRAGMKSEQLHQSDRRIAGSSVHRQVAEKVRAKAEERSAAAKVHRDSAKARVIVVSDTIVRVDSILVAVPAPVVSLLRADDRQIKMDSLTISALTIENATLREERDAWKERAQLLKPPRFGFKSGVAAGVSAVLAIVVLLGR